MLDNSGKGGGWLASNQGPLRVVHKDDAQKSTQQSADIVGQQATQALNTTQNLLNATNKQQLEQAINKCGDVDLKERLMKVYEQNQDLSFATLKGKLLNTAISTLRQRIITYINTLRNQNYLTEAEAEMYLKRLSNYVDALVSGTGAGGSASSFNLLKNESKTQKQNTKSIIKISNTLKELQAKIAYENTQHHLQAAMSWLKTLVAINTVETPIGSGSPVGAGAGPAEENKSGIEHASEEGEKRSGEASKGEARAEQAASSENAEKIAQKKSVIMNIGGEKFKKDKFV